MMDRFTKWPECIALRAPTAVNVAKALVSQVMTGHGVPVHLQSDRGALFTSQIFAKISRIMGMRQKLSSAYTPQTQGLIKRWNGTMVQLLKQYVATDQKDWDQYVDLMFAYRTSSHSSAGLTPFQLIYGREAKLPIHLLTADIGPTDHDGEAGYVGSLRQ